MAAAVTAIPSFAAGFELDLEELPGAVNLSSPVAVVSAGDGSGRLFIARRQGIIHVWQNDSILAEPLLDITDQVTCCCSELGVSGLVFDPGFETNGYFYVNYTEDLAAPPDDCPVAGDQILTVLARYQVQSFAEPEGDPNFADPATETRLLAIPHLGTIHNAGDLHFGPDGFLYMSVGESGMSQFAQDPTTLRGKILRIDAHGTPPAGPADVCGAGAQPYGIPADNPFAGDDGICDEIWSLGFRNPWRFSFDRATGDLFIGDVGQEAWEEISFQPAASGGGENFGWRCYEGNHQFDFAGCNADPAAYDFPILEYQNSGSARCAVTAGYRYRGEDFFLLRGLYLYGDFCTGEVFFALPEEGGGWTAPAVAAFTPGSSLRISSFGEDEDGELYVVAYNSGRIWRIVERLVPAGALPFDLDLNGIADPLVDGIVILRHVFGFTGEALVSGLLDPLDCGRDPCDHTEIAPVLAALAPYLDADGNGEVDPLTDGVVIVRYLIGVEGDALTENAVADDCTRCEPAEIAAFLADLAG